MGRIRIRFNAWLVSGYALTTTFGCHCHTVVDLLQLPSWGVGQHASPLRHLQHALRRCNNVKCNFLCQQPRTHSRFHVICHMEAYKVTVKQAVLFSSVFFDIVTAHYHFAVSLSLLVIRCETCEESMHVIQPKNSYRLIYWHVLTAVFVTRATKIHLNIAISITTIHSHNSAMDTEQTISKQTFPVCL